MANEYSKDSINAKENQEGYYGINIGTSKDKMFYVLIFYVSVIILGILFLAWKLRGYNRREQTFDPAVIRALMAEKAARNRRKAQQNSDEKVNVREKVNERIETISQHGEETEVMEKGEEIIQDYPDKLAEVNHSLKLKEKGGGRKRR